MFSDKGSVKKEHRVDFRISLLKNNSLDQNCIIIPISLMNQKEKKCISSPLNNADKHTYPSISFTRKELMNMESNKVMSVLQNE